jgi:hypothetical protein
MTPANRIVASGALALIATIPLSFLVVGLGGRYGYTQVVWSLPGLALCAYWLLWRFRKR